jgi:hypothetical protein
LPDHKVRGHEHQDDPNQQTNKVAAQRVHDYSNDEAKMTA